MYRRRLGVLGAFVGVALVLGISVGAGDDATSDKRPTTTAPPALDRQVGELLMMSFDGPQAPPYIRRRLRDGQGSGVILFGRNVTSAAGLRRLTRSIQRAAGGDALIATDQEGGEIRNVPFAGPELPQSAFGSATIDAPRTALERTDLEPFRAAVAADAALVMAGHALYPAFDAHRIASQSQILLDDVLRGELGYRGAVVTDSIEAQAVLDRSDVGTAAVRSIAAGAGSWNLVYPRVLRRARRSAAFRARVDESARRVLALKRRLGLPRRR